MNCCSVPGPSGTSRGRGTARFFDRFAKSYARSHRSGSLEKIQKQLIAGVLPHLISPSRIVEIGCGVGALHQNLLGSGEHTAVGVDLSTEMLGHARRFATEQGFDKRTEYLLGDYTELTEQIGQADVMLLDKVVCCYQQVELLLSTSLQKTRQVYALSHPRNFFGIRWGFAIHKALARLLRWDFFPCWHVWSDIHATIERSGFRSVGRTQTFLWESTVYLRESVPTSA